MNWRVEGGWAVGELQLISSLWHHHTHKLATGDMTLMWMRVAQAQICRQLRKENSASFTVLSVLKFGANPHGDDERNKRPTITLLLLCNDKNWRAKRAHLVVWMRNFSIYTYISLRGDGHTYQHTVIRDSKYALKRVKYLYACFARQNSSMS